ncbi:MAG: aldehyde dehydrogenase [Sedimenticola sp.]|jgi:hypothetical protein|nr:MAG: aldehyde dehydrogenase [Sedimenticola sp.]
MTVKPFFPVFIVLIGVIIYAYYAPDRKPEGASTLTPKEYIEMVEKNKAEKLEKKAESEADESSSSSTNGDMQQQDK